MICVDPTMEAQRDSFVNVHDPPSRCNDPLGRSCLCQGILQPTLLRAFCGKAIAESAILLKLGRDIANMQIEVREYRCSDRASFVRLKGIGKLLMEKMEFYFKKKGCNVSGVDVFPPNRKAYRLYKKLGYRDRNIWMAKNL